MSDRQQQPQRLAASSSARSSTLRPFLALLALLLYLASLHLSGLYLFTRGFLLSRLTLNDVALCPSSLPPHNLSNLDLGPHNCNPGLPPSHSRAVVIIIDALRYDFLHPFSHSNPALAHPYHNALTIPTQLTAQQPANSMLFHFVADPPTTTLQRIKGLTTGSLPTFVDAGSNFGGAAIEEDNWLAQLRRSAQSSTVGNEGSQDERKVAFMGDDTWITVFPPESGVFGRNMTFPFDSFNVEDLHTVDEGVIRHLLPLLDPSRPESNQWNLIVAHTLGVDHVGHRLGPEHAQMRSKLEQMNEMLERVVDMIDEDTLLVLMGDHGMDGRGDHGGESELEVGAGLWVYSKRGFGSVDENAEAADSDERKQQHVHQRRRQLLEELWSPSSPLASSVSLDGTIDLPPSLDEPFSPLSPWISPPLVRSIPQIDFVPTISLLLGLPVPFNNLGTIIPELFLSFKDSTSASAPKKSWSSLQSTKSSDRESETAAVQRLLAAVRLNAQQIKRYLDDYHSSPSGADLDPFWTRLESLWNVAMSHDADLQKNHDHVKPDEIKSTVLAYYAFTRRAFSGSRSVWAQFNPSLMIAGILVLLGGVLLGWAVWGTVGRGSERSVVSTVPQDQTDPAALEPLVWSILGHAGLGAIAALGIVVSVVLGVGSSDKQLPVSSLQAVLFGVAFSAELASLVSVFRLRPALAKHHGRGRWSFDSVQGPLLVVIHVTLFASNSFTVWEDRAVLYLLQSALIVMLLRGFAAAHTRLRSRIVSLALLAVVCVRIAAESRLCREEQQPYCHTTFYSSASSSLSSPWAVFLALPVAWYLPRVVRYFLATSKADSGLAAVFLSGLRFALLAGAGHWLLDWAESSPEITDNLRAVLTMLKLGTGRAALVAIVIVGGVFWYSSPLCIDVQREEVQDGTALAIHPTQKKVRVVVLGFANVFGSSYLLFLCTVFALILLLTQPAGQLSLSACLTALITLLEVFDARRDARLLIESFERTGTPDASPGSVMPSFFESAVVALVGFLAFFGTGHQATLPSIQWRVAFVGFKKVVYPFSPLLVILNSFGPFLLSALAAPLLAVWNVSPATRGEPPMTLVSHVAKASLAFQLYHALITLSTVLFAAHFRRHLMVWKIFAPRFMLGGVSLLTADVGLLLAVGALAVVAGKVARTFGTRFL